MRRTPEGSLLFYAFLAFVATERVVELTVSRANARALVARGGRVVHVDGYGALVAVHAGLFVAALAEWHVAPWAGFHLLTPLFLALFVAADLLRYWSMLTLRERWTTKVVVLPSAPLVTGGPYRHLRHPIYVAVAVIVPAVPAAFGLWATALVLGAANLVALRRRIALEERALDEARTTVRTVPVKDAR